MQGAKERKAWNVLPSLLRQWYHLTTPPAPASDAPMKERETARRAQLTSTIILLSLLVLLRFCWEPSSSQLAFCAGCGAPYSSAKRADADGG